MKVFLRSLLAVALAAGAAGCDDDPTGAGAPSQVAVSGGGDQTALAGGLLADSIAVTVTDDDGDPVRGAEVRFEVTSGGGFIYPSVDTTDAQGLASTEWRLGTVAADSQRAEVRVMTRNGGVAATTVVRATAQARAGQRLQPASVREQTAPLGTALPDSLAVRLLDELGNGVPGVTVNWIVPEFAGTVSPNPATTGPDGIARAQWTLGAATGRHTVEAVVDGVPGPVGFAATATSAFTIDIQQPRSDRMYGDSLPIRVQAQTTAGTITRVTARVEDRAVNLSAGQGSLDLSGLAEGQKVLRVAAVTAGGDSAFATQPFTLNRAPRLTVAGPPAGAVIRDGTVEIDADCMDASGCARVAVYAARFPDIDDLSTWTPLAEGTTGFDGSAPVAALNGQRITLVVEATDVPGRRTVVKTYPIFVDNTPNWTEVASAGTQALDTDGTRILYVDSTSEGPLRVLVRALAGGTATELLEVAGDEGNPIQGRLFPGGAIFATRDRVYEWRGGTTTLLATNAYSASRSLEVEGTWALWLVGSSVYRRDLAAGTSVLVATGSEGGADVAVNGDVAHTGPGNFVYRWRNGVSTEVSAGLQGYSPRIDPTQVAFATPAGSIYLARGGTPVLLATLSPAPSAPFFFEVNGGWAAFVKPDPGGVNHVFSVAPDGTQRQVFTGGDSNIAAVGPTGEVVFARTSRTVAHPRRFLSLPPYTAQPLDVGGSLGDIRFEGTELYAVVGRSVFRVND